MAILKLFRDSEPDPETGVTDDVQAAWAELSSPDTKAALEAADVIATAFNDVQLRSELAGLLLIESPDQAQVSMLTSRAHEHVMNAVNQHRITAESINEPPVEVDVEREAA